MWYFHVGDFLVGGNELRVNGADGRVLDVRRLSARVLGIIALRRAREMSETTLRFATVFAPSIDESKKTLRDEEEVNSAEYSRRPMEVSGGRRGN